jgi:hypothetical protein
MARFSTQIERSLNEFDRKQIHFVIHDDFQKDARAVYRELLLFLQVDPYFQPVFQTVNPNKRLRSPLLQTIMRNPPEPVRKIARALLPVEWRTAAKRSIKRMNTSYVKRAPMQPETRKRLQQEFTDEVKRLGELLGRDFSHWVTNGQGFR